MSVSNYKVLDTIAEQLKAIFSNSLNFNKVIASVLAVFELFGTLIFDTPQTPRGQALNLSDYHLVWSDEFDGSSIDAETWSLHFDVTVRRGSFWDMDMLQVDDGKLTIKAEYLENGKYGAGWYTAGIDTRKSYNKTYGYFECRCKCPSAQGLWSAFWMFSPGIGNIDGTGKDGAEIDIFESPYYGDNAFNAMQ